MKAAIFDLDGTLIDSLPDITDAFNALLAEWSRPPLGPETTVRFVGRGVEVAIDRLIAETGLPEGDRAKLLDRFIVHYKAAAANTRMMPGAMEALNALRDTGWRLGLVTNKARAPLIPTLAAAGLEDTFDCVLAGDDLDRCKPDPEPLLHCMAELGGGICLYIGDSEVDAETAQRAGMPFALFTEGIRTTDVADIPHTVAFNDFRMLAGICARFLA